MLLKIEDVKISKFYSSYCRSGAILLGYLKVEDVGTYGYFSCPSSSHGRVVPVFDRSSFKYNMFDKATKRVVEYTGSFHFDSEPPDKELCFSKEKPFVLFFVGCDDGHTGMRFETKAKMEEFLELVETYDDVVEICNGNSLLDDYFLHFHN